MSNPASPFNVPGMPDDAPGLNEEALGRQLADGAAAKTLASRALALAEREGDFVQQAFAHLNLALQALRNESMEAGAEHLDSARRLLAKAPGANARVGWLAEHVEGMRLRRLGQHAEAAEVFKELHQRAGAERPLLDAYLTLSSLAIVLGMGQDRYDALERFYEALALARRTGESSLVVNALNNLGSFQLDLYNLEDTLPLLEECLAGAIAIDSRRQIIFAAGNLAQCLCAMGLAKEALAVASEHLIGRIRPEDIPSLQRDEEIAHALLENGLLDEAEARLASAQHTDEMTNEISTHRVWLRARLLLARGRAAEALALCLAHQASAAQDGTAPPVDQVRLLRIAAEAAATAGEHALSYTLLSEAYAIQEQLLGRAAKARFLSLQISHEVQRAAAERDTAQRTARELEELNRSLREQISENERLQEQLRTEAIEDPLTGLHNRRFLVDAGSGLLALAKRRGDPLTLALIDMDNFKQVNDRHGHDAGDLVLCAFAKLVRGMMRSSDVVCRYGGEEFVLLFALSDEASAIARLEAMQSEFRALCFEEAGATGLTCTFSAGVSVATDDTDTLHHLLERSDKAMYAAKRAGRDRIVTWSQLRALST
jgi:two-component system, cell cycle response regulator